MVSDRGPAGQEDERHHGGNVMAEPEAVRRGDRTGCQVARRGGRLDRRRKQRVNLLEYPVEQLARIIPVLEKAVEDKAQPRVELGPVDSAAEQEIPHHEVGHADQRRGRWLESGKTFESRIAFAAEPQDLAIKVLLARKVTEQQRLGNSRRLGELLCRRPGKALAGEQRHRRRDDRLAAFVAV